jgi:hypothetical protein
MVFAEWVELPGIMQASAEIDERRHRRGLAAKQAWKGLRHLDAGERKRFSAFPFWRRWLLQAGGFCWKWIDQVHRPRVSLDGFPIEGHLLVESLL